MDRASLLVLATVVAFCTLLPHSNAQCANNLATYHPLLRTLTSNSTWFIVQVPEPAVQSALEEAFPLQDLSLLDVPATDKTLFPHGFPPDMHPVLATIGLTDDIRMSALQIDGGLKQASVYATYVSQNRNPTPLCASLISYIAGETETLPNGLVPAVASPLLFAGTPLRLGQFNPKAPAYVSDNGGTRTAQAKWALLSNPLSGPGIYIEAIDMLFRKTESAKKYTAKTFKTLINQPAILPSGLCQRNQY